MVVSIHKFWGKKILDKFDVLLQNLEKINQKASFTSVKEGFQQNYKKTEQFTCTSGDG